MKTKLLLETGCNHQGDVKIALKMIDQAAELKAWGVKFQKRDIDSFPDELKKKKRDPLTSFGKNYYEHRKVLEFNKTQLFELKKYTENKGLIFVCSAFDVKSIADLIEIGCKNIKLPSQLYTDKFLQKELLAAKEMFNTAIFVSTGMHNAEEIINNDWLNNADLIFHCISVYPHYIKEMNLCFIHALKNLSNIRGNYKVGYSSHDYLGYGIKYAVAAGAEYIERHFTLDKTMKGSDHSTVSSDYAEIKNIIKEVEKIEAILGDEKKECSEKEKATRLIYRGF